MAEIWPKLPYWGLGISGRIAGGQLSSLLDFLHWVDQLCLFALTYKNNQVACILFGPFDPLNCWYMANIVMTFLGGWMVGWMGYWVDGQKNWEQCLSQPNGMAKRKKLWADKDLSLLSQLSGRKNWEEFLSLPDLVGVGAGAELGNICLLLPYNCEYH